MKITFHRLTNNDNPSRPGPLPPDSRPLPPDNRPPPSDNRPLSQLGRQTFTRQPTSPLPSQLNETRRFSRTPQKGLQMRRMQSQEDTPLSGQQDNKKKLGLFKQLVFQRNIHPLDKENGKKQSPVHLKEPSSRFLNLQKENRNPERKREKQAEGKSPGKSPAKMRAKIFQNTTPKKEAKGQILDSFGLAKYSELRAVSTLCPNQSPHVKESFGDIVSLINLASQKASEVDWRREWRPAGRQRRDRTEQERILQISFNMSPFL